MPRPCWILDGLEPNGKPQWALPPDSHTSENQCVGLRDWFAREDLWKERKLSQIPGCGVDTTHMMRDSFRNNLGCSPMAADCNECKHYIPNRCLLAHNQVDMVCPADTPEQPHTTDDCRQCKHNHPQGYFCKKWLKSPELNWKNLWGKEKGKIGIICAPGPHLAEHKKEIEGFYADRDKYCVMGVSRAINAVPLHYYFTIERRKPAYWNPEKMKFPQTTLIAATLADWRMCRAFRTRYFGEAFNTCDEVGNMLDSGTERITIALGNVSADAMMAMARLGVKEIWLYGYEFACTLTDDEAGKQTVANYYFDLDIRKQHFSYYGVNQQKYFPAYGVDGELCGTSYGLLSVSFYCEAIANLCASHGIPVYNGTRKGCFWLGVEDRQAERHKAEIATLTEQLRRANEQTVAGPKEDPI